MNVHVYICRGLFKHYLTSICRRSKLNLKLCFETQSFKPKSNKNCLDCLERALFRIFFTFWSHQECRMSVQKEQGDLKKHADTSWAMTYSHKNQSFMKKRGQHVTHTLSMHKESKVNKFVKVGISKWWWKGNIESEAFLYFLFMFLKFFWQWNFF